MEKTYIEQYLKEAGKIIVNNTLSGILHTQKTIIHEITQIELEAHSFLDEDNKDPRHVNYFSSDMINLYLTKNIFSNAEKRINEHLENFLNTQDKDMTDHIVAVTKNFPPKKSLLELVKEIKILKESSTTITSKEQMLTKQLKKRIYNLSHSMIPFLKKIPNFNLNDIHIKQEEYKNEHSHYRTVVFNVYNQMIVDLLKHPEILLKRKNKINLDKILKDTDDFIHNVNTKVHPNDFKMAWSDCISSRNIINQYIKNVNTQTTPIIYEEDITIEQQHPSKIMVKAKIEELRKRVENTNIKNYSHK